MIDSADTLASDIGSTETYKFLFDLLSIISNKTTPSRLILHLCSPCPLLPWLLQTSFCPYLCHLVAHPLVLLKHIALELSTPPPPATDEAKFWGVFLPVQEREYETLALVFGSSGDGSGNSEEFVVEVILRGGKDGSGRRRAVERVLEGWVVAKAAPCDLTSLRGLQGLWKKNVAADMVCFSICSSSCYLNLPLQSLLLILLRM